jgi:hypothetical protein
MFVCFQTTQTTDTLSNELEINAKKKLRKTPIVKHGDKWIGFHEMKNFFETFILWQF